MGSQSRSLPPEEKRPRIILVEGEFQDPKLMTEKAKLYGVAPVAIKLRELQTLGKDCQIGEPNNSYSIR